MLELADVTRAELQDRARVPSGRLRISGPHGIDLTELPALINVILGHYPEVSISLVLTNRMVDLAEEGIDIALRFGPSADENLIVRKLVSMELSVCAAPMYWREHGVPAHPSELAHHVALFSTHLNPSAEVGLRSRRSANRGRGPWKAGRNGKRPADPGCTAGGRCRLSTVCHTEALCRERATSARLVGLRSPRYVAVGRLPAAPAQHGGASCATRFPCGQVEAFRIAGENRRAGELTTYEGCALVWPHFRTHGPAMKACFQRGPRAVGFRWRSCDEDGARAPTP